MADMGCVTAKATRIGNRRNNQDRLAITRSDSGILLILADGMGGHADGDLAALTLVETIKQHYRDADKPVSKPKRFLEQAIRAAHDAVMQAGHRQVPPTTPCTTCVVCLVQDNTAWWAHVGDSRFYLLRDRQVECRTRDHSYVEDLFHKGEISEDEMLRHPMRNYLTECVGGKRRHPNITHGRYTQLQDGDLLLLCSDGLWGPLSDTQIIERLYRGRLSEAVSELAYQAEHVSYPSSDNISLIAVRFKQRVRKSDEKPALPAATSKMSALSTAIHDIRQAIEDFGHELKK
jgi:serine/threonine protein phosphatase PrpC